MSRKPNNIVPDLMKLVGIVLICQCASVAARSVLTPDSDERDPMVAMPSAQQPQVEAQEVQYVTYQPAGSHAVGPQPEMIIEYPGQAQANQVQFVSEVQSEQYEVVQPGSQTQVEEADCNQNHKPMATHETETDSGAQTDADASSDFAGQLVYVNRNGNEASQLKGAAASWSQASDLSATILTEIPVKDMSPEVLSKLRRDYGVKVVATRERPGANLVINCEEYSGSDNSICGRRSVGQEIAHQPQLVEVAQIESGDTVNMEPGRGITTTFHHIEHLVQPTSHQIAETQTEGYPTEGFLRDASGANGRGAGQDEQVVYEAVTVQPGSAYESAANHEPTKETQPPKYAPSSAAQEAPESYGSVQRSRTSSPVAESFDKSETQELPTGFDEQQHNEGGSSSRKSSPERTARRKMTASNVQWPDHESAAKQVAPSESEIGATRA